MSFFILPSFQEATSSPVLMLVVGIGLGVSVLVWCLCQLGYYVWQRSHSTAEDTRWRDTPPWGFRCLWRGIRCLAPLMPRLLGARWQQIVAQRLEQAGWQYMLTPAQWCAAIVLWGGMGVIWALLLWMITGYFSVWLFAVFVLSGMSLPVLWLRDQLRCRSRAIVRALPFYLDLITLCVEAGLNLQGAIQQAVQKGPAGPLRDEWQRLLRDVRSGKPRLVALQAMAERLAEPAISHLVTALSQAETVGMTLAPLLRAQAEQRRAERFLRAEKLAMQAPVKLLMPLIACIFPCTFLIIGFPIGMKLMAVSW